MRDKNHVQMKIEVANPTHVNQIFKLLQAVAQNMREKGIMQWNENYPTLAHVKTDVANKIVFLGIHDHELSAVISIDAKQSPEYGEIPWKYTSGEIMVVHRLAVSPTAQKKGLGNLLMDFAHQKAINEGYSAIRLDAFSENENTLHFYEKRGYKKRGEIYFPYRKAPFYCFEKKIK